MTTVAIVVALVLVAVVGFAVFFARGKGGAHQLAPPAGAPRPMPSPRSEPPGAGGVAGRESGARRLPDAPPPRGESARPPRPLVSEVGAPAREMARPAQPSGAPGALASKKDMAGLRKGLAATRGGFIAKLTELFQGKKEIDAAILQQMEEVMLASDVGPKTTEAILTRLRESLGRNELRDADAVWAALRAEATRILDIGGGAIRMATKPTVVLMVGVNGVGKTTTIGKLATRYNTAGKKVVLAAGDTFRAAAVQQLEVWGKRVGADVVKGKEGADPGAVAFEATKKAQEASADVLL